MFRVAEFEANLGHLRTREGMAIAKRKGKLRGKQPKLPPSAQRSIRRRYADGEVSLADLAEEYSVGRSTIHQTPAPEHDTGENASAAPAADPASAQVKQIR